MHLTLIIGTYSKLDILENSLTPHYCDEDGNIFNKDEIKMHKVQILECQWCNKSFSTNYRLNRHMSYNCKKGTQV